MATRKTTQQTELQQAGKQLSNAAKAVGTAVSHKFEAMGDAVSAGVAKAKKQVTAKKNEAKRDWSSLVKAAETKVKQSQAQLKKAGDDARKAVLAAEKKLEATKRSTSKKLASLQASAERYAKAHLKAVEKEAAALKKAVTGEGVDIMQATGSGELFVADMASEVQVFYLENDMVSCNGASVLAFSGSIEWDIQRIGSGAGMVAGGMYNVTLRGTGYVALTTKGDPVVLDVSGPPTFADPNAVVFWTSGVTMSVKTDTGGLKSMLRGGTGEMFQLAFGGQGYVMIQPAENVVTTGGQAAGGGLNRSAFWVQKTVPSEALACRRKCRSSAVIGCVACHDRCTSVGTPATRKSTGSHWPSSRRGSLPTVCCTS